MSNNHVGALIERMSEYLDKGRPGVTSIRVKCRRSTAIRHVSPLWRGGPLYFRGREIVTNDPPPVPVKPEPKPKKRKRSSKS